MEQYVWLGEVQQRLEQWQAEHGEPTRFLHAMALLKQEGRYHTGEQMPRADFLAWDGDDIGQFHDLLARIPVDLKLAEEQDASSPAQLAPVGRELNSVPIKVSVPQKTSMHRHEHFEFLYVLAGEGQLYTRTETLPLPEGTLCVVAPDLIHDVRGAGGSEVISIAFWPDSMRDVLHRLLQGENIMTEFFHTSLDLKKPGYVVLNLPPERKIRLLLRDIFQEGHSEEPYAGEFCIQYIGLLFYHALRHCAAEGGNPAGADRRTGVPMAAVMKYIQDHYRTVSLAEVAAAFHYEQDYLSRKIKGYMGRSYMDLVLEMKVEAAKRMLRETQAGMAEIGERSGFGSAVHFSQLFRKKTGMSPTEYRRREWSEKNKDRSPSHMSFSS